MNSNWAKKELSLCDLGDKRLNQRLIQLADRFLQSPESPINQACQNWAATKAAYRFFQNDNVSYQNIIESHVQATKNRINEFSTILAIQDTTYFNYSAHQKTIGLCPLSRKEGKNKKGIVTSGLVMHSTLAVSTEGLPLGILNQKTYSRELLSKEKKEIKKRTHNTALPIEEKDSFRWLECLQNTHDTLGSQPPKVVTVCDRESDIYDFFRLAESLKSPVLVRASHNRTVNKKSSYSELTGEKLWDLMKKKKSLGKLELQRPQQDDQPARLAKCDIKMSEFILNVPKHHIKKRKENLPSLKLYAVDVLENNPPQGLDSIDWMLLYNLPIKNLKQALEKIEWYCMRWRIEVFHKILKSGLKVEECRLSTADRLIRYLYRLLIKITFRICRFNGNSTEYKKIPPFGRTCFLYQI